MADILLSIVFPNWNGASDTRDFLESIRNTDFLENQLEIIMVDNNSADNSVSLVQEKYPEVKILKLDKNYGPAYARNRGIELARGELIFCSDDDQLLATNTLQILANKLQMNSDVGVAGATVLTKSKPHQVVSCGYRFNRWLGTESGLNNCQQIKQCDWVAGCGLMFRRNLIDEIGKFDEKFFFFGEDADFCLRAKKTGYKVINLPDAAVYHGRAGQTASLTPQDKYSDYYRAKFRLILKHSSALQKLVSLSLHLTIFSLARHMTGKKEIYRLKLRALSDTVASCSNDVLKESKNL